MSANPSVAFLWPVMATDLSQLLILYFGQTNTNKNFFVPLPHPNPIFFIPSSLLHWLWRYWRWQLSQFQEPASHSLCPSDWLRKPVQGCVYSSPALCLDVFGSLELWKTGYWSKWWFWLLPQPGALFQDFNHAALSNMVTASICHKLAWGNVHTEAQAKDWWIALWEDRFNSFGTTSVSNTTKQSGVKLLTHVYITCIRHLESLRAQLACSWIQGKLPHQISQ